MLKKPIPLCLMDKDECTDLHLMKKNVRYDTYFDRQVEIRYFFLRKDLFTV